MTELLLVYGFEISDREQILCAVGVAPHFSDPHDRQVPVIVNAFKAMARRCLAGGIVVGVESTPSPVAPVLGNALAARGDSALAFHLADQFLSPVFHLDPPYPMQFMGMCKKFPRNEVIYYLFARILWQWHDTLKREPDFDEYFARQCDLLGGVDVVFDLPLLESVHNELFGGTPNLMDATWWRSMAWLDPREGWPAKSSDRPVQRITEALHKYRDDYAIQLLETLWIAGLNIFVQCGEPHVAVYEQRLFDLLRRHSRNVRRSPLDQSLHASPQNPRPMKKGGNLTKLNLIRAAHGQPVLEQEQEHVVLQRLTLYLLKQPRYIREPPAGSGLWSGVCRMRGNQLRARHPRRGSNRDDVSRGHSPVYEDPIFPLLRHRANVIYAPAEIEREKFDSALDELCSAGLCKCNEKGSYSLTQNGLALLEHLERHAPRPWERSPDSFLVPMTFPLAAI